MLQTRTSLRWALDALDFAFPLNSLVPDVDGGVGVQGLVPSISN